MRRERPKTLEYVAEPLRVGAILRRFRKQADLAVEQLAAEANVSESLLRKVEAGHRPATRQTIAALAPVLGIPTPHVSQLALLVDSGHLANPPHYQPPTPRELRLLDVNPFPACYMRSPTWAQLVDGALHEVVATNAAFDRFFPGLTPGVGILEYELLHRPARDTFIRWEEDAHQLVQVCRTMLTTYVSDAGIEAMCAGLRQTPEFDGMWDTPFPGHVHRETVWIRNLNDEAEFEMYFRVSRDSSPWLHYTLTPVDLARYFVVYPPMSFSPPPSR